MAPSDKLQINLIFSLLNLSLHALVFEFTKLITIQVNFYFPFADANQMLVKLLRGLLLCCNILILE